MNVITSVVCMGAHILDVLVRPVTDIPPGQETALVEQMWMTAAGTAAGTALTFAELGAAVRTAGAIGTDAAGGLGSDHGEFDLAAADAFAANSAVLG